MTFTLTLIPCIIFACISAGALMVFGIVQLNAYMIRKAHQDALRRAAAINQERKRREESQRLYDEMMNILLQQKYAQQSYRQPRTTVRSTSTVSIEGARRLLASYGGYKAAVKKTHPDLGGNAAEFRKVQSAKELLDKYGF